MIPTTPDQTDADLLKVLASARDTAFSSAGNLDLSKEQRKQFSNQAKELVKVITELAEKNISEISGSLAQQSEIKSATDEIISATKEIDSSNSSAQNADAKLGWFNKLVASAQKFATLFPKP
jgi:predicted ribosome quality control (RQC) complex YloA/Tae2 family protein